MMISSQKVYSILSHHRKRSSHFQPTVISYIFLRIENSFLDKPPLEVFKSRKINTRYRSVNLKKTILETPLPKKTNKILDKLLP